MSGRTSLNVHGERNVGAQILTFSKKVFIFDFDNYQIVETLNFDLRKE